MAALNGGGGLEASGLGDTKFDASQYAFFGNNVMGEVELGGLEDDGDGDAAFVGPGDEEYPPTYGSDIEEPGTECSPFRFKGTIMSTKYIIFVN